jgi:xanthine dehydrogenase iron-sulfur cluster and FAD-binding subunit A
VEAISRDRLTEMHGRIFRPGNAIVAVSGDFEPQEMLAKLEQAFVECGAVQCGFCTPGMIVQAKNWLEAHPHASRAEIERGIEGNLCRCTGYGSIMRAAGMLCRDFAALPADPSARLAALTAARVVPPSLESFAHGVSGCSTAHT